MLRFVDKREIDSIEQLADVYREQLRVAGALYDGEDLPAQARLSPDGEETSFHGMCELWRIVDGERHAYDAWFYMSDSGTIFRAGTTDTVAEIVQCGLECGDHLLRAEIGPAMVEARLLPQVDSSFGEFAELLAKQQAGVVMSPILAEGTMPASPQALASASGLEEVSQAELARLVTAELRAASKPRKRPAKKPAAKRKAAAKKPKKAPKPKPKTKKTSATKAKAKAKRRKR